MPFHVVYHQNPYKSALSINSSGTLLTSKIININAFPVDNQILIIATVNIDTLGSFNFSKNSLIST